MKYRITSVILIIAALGLGFLVKFTEREESRFNFKLGLDLAGGTELVYRADTTEVDSADLDDRLDSLRTLIEKRINPFGVGEQVVQLEGANAFNKNPKLVIELPGVTNTEEAIQIIGKPPTLDFRLLTPAGEE